MLVELVVVWDEPVAKAMANVQSARLMVAATVYIQKLVHAGGFDGRGTKRGERLRFSFGVVI